jgi:SAM-dependent methyltransferase
MTSTHDPVLAADEDAGRFGFGDNWRAFIERFDERRADVAARSICDLVGVEELNGRTFLDAGCGSGLFSLAAHRLGAVVRSFDLDENSVACARSLKERFDRASDSTWQIDRGSVLDASYVGSLGRFDVVYSWGVVHHTGRMWAALDNLAKAVTPNGLLVVAIYNDQGIASRMWRAVKRTYNLMPPRLRFLVLWPAFIRLWGPTSLRDLFLGHPGRSWREYTRERGMSPVIDVRDWVGGYPFEVATPSQVIDFCSARGFTLERSVLRSGIGCNEFVFRRAGRPPATTL